jgi:PAS domain S-box-containing protein
MNGIKRSDLSENTIKHEIIGISIVFLSVFVLSAIFNSFDLLQHWIAGSGSYFLKNFLVAIIVSSIFLLFFSIKRYFELTSEINRRLLLEKNHEKYRQYSEYISQEVSEMVFILDHEMRIKFLNKTALVRNPNAKGKYFYDTFPNFNYKLVEQYFKKAFRSKIIQKGIIREQPKFDIHGGIKWNITAIPIIDTDGDTEEIIMIISFISEIESNRPFRHALESFVNNTDLAMIMLDSEDNIVFWNHASERIYGYNSSEIVSSNIIRLQSNKEISLDQQSLLLKDESNTILRKTKQNNELYVACSRIPLKNTEGVDSGCMDISYDVTKILEHESNFIRKIKLWETFPEITDVPYCFVDDNNKVMFCNDKFYDISGFGVNSNIHTYPAELALYLNKKQEHYKFKSKKIDDSNQGVSGYWIFGRAIKEDHVDLNLSILESYIISSEKTCFLESESEGIVFISDKMKSLLNRSGESDPINFLQNIKEINKKDYIEKDRFFTNSSIETKLNTDNGTLRIKNIAFTENQSRFRVVIFEKIKKMKPNKPIISEDFRSIFNSLDFGLSVMRKDPIANSFKIVQINDHMKRMEKQNNTKILNENMENVVPIRKYSEKFRMLTKVLRTGETEQYEVLITDKDKKPLKWQIHYLYKLDDSHVLTAMIDIDKPVQEKKDLREEMSYRNYLHSFSGIAYRLDINLKPIFYIGAVMNITGYSQNELSSGEVQWTSLINKEDINEYMDYRKKVSSMTGNEYSFEYRIINKNGDELWISEHIQSTTDENGVISYIDGTIYDITKRKLAEIELKESRSVLRALTEHFESVRESEKKELAHEIHDDLGHALTILKLDLAWLQNKKYLREDTLQERVLEMSHQIDQIIKKVRYISTELRPSILDHFGIIAAIEWKASEFQKRTAIRCRLSIEANDIEMDEHTSTVVFRIFQETLTNAARHANPSRIDINVFIDNGVFNLSISDNGVGMKPESLKNNNSLGLVGIRERAKFISGEVFINSVVNYGTTVTLKVPLKKQKVI